MKIIKDCINRQLTDLYTHSLKLEDLTTKVLALLPTNLAVHCKVGSFNKGCLVLSTSDAVWASQLRFFLPELRDKLRVEAGLHQLLSIKVVVSESESMVKKTSVNKIKPLSEKAKDCLISESQHCQYEPLKNALMRLGGYIADK